MVTMGGRGVLNNDPSKTIVNGCSTPADSNFSPSYSGFSCAFRRYPVHRTILSHRRTHHPTPALSRQYLLLPGLMAKTHRRILPDPEAHKRERPLDLHVTRLGRYNLVGLHHRKMTCFSSTMKLVMTVMIFWTI